MSTAEVIVTDGDGRAVGAQTGKVVVGPSGDAGVIVVRRAGMSVWPL